MKIFIPAAQWKSKEYPPAVLIITKSYAQFLKLRQTLEKNGCQVYWTETGAEARERAKQNSFDLIVLDLDLSIENGLVTYRDVRRYPELANLPAVILGLRELFNQRMNGWFKEGPIHFLVKDATVEARLLQLVQLAYYLRYRYLDLVP